MIDLDALGCRGRTGWVFRDVSLHVEPGEVFGLVGPNGAGKSLLLAVCATIVRPHAGSVRIAGLDARTRSTAVRRTIGFVPEQVGFNPRTTVREDLDFFAVAHGLARPDRRAAVDDGLRRWGLREVADEPMGGLSAGLARRVALARAWLHRPRVLLLDDPGSRLDADGHATLWGALEEHALNGGSALVVAYDVKPLARVARRIGLLARGALSDTADADPNATTFRLPSLQEAGSRPR
jgi:ABC-2 type transport system ATP-binding protein